jgi:hypothetical protein
MPIAKCHKCNAEILWAVTDPGNRPMPVDAKPEKRLILQGNRCKIVTTYTPHWATCPNADEFRKERKHD